LRRFYWVFCNAHSVFFLDFSAENSL